MKALDKLRRCFDNYAILNTVTAKKVVRDLADEIEKELKERYIELPLDKDGVPIHIGDEMVSCGRHKFRFIVSELDFTDAFVHAVGIVGDIKYYFAPSKIVHYHKQTVRKVLEEALNKAASLDHNEGRWLRAAYIDDIVSEIEPKL